MITARVPSEPASSGSRGEASAPSPEPDDPAVAEHHGGAHQEVGGGPVAVGVGPGGVAGHVAADGAGARRTRIGRVVEAGGGGAPVDGGRHHPRLRAQAPALHVQLEDAVHPAEVEDDPAVARDRPRRVAGPRPPRDDRQAVTGADLDHAADLVGGGGEDHGIGEPSLAGRPEGVEGVGGEVGGADVQMGRPDLALQVAQGCGGEHPQDSERRRAAAAPRPDRRAGAGRGTPASRGGRARQIGRTDQRVVVAILGQRWPSPRRSTSSRRRSAG